MGLLHNDKKKTTQDGPHNFFSKLKDHVGHKSSASSSPASSRNNSSTKLHTLSSMRKRSGTSSSVTPKSNSHENLPHSKEDVQKALAKAELGLPSIDKANPKSSQKLSYNPYGLNGITPGGGFSSNLNNNNNNNSNNLVKKHSPTFTIDGAVEDRKNELPKDIADPNDYLPTGFRLENSLMTNNFEYVSNNEKDIGKGASASIKKIHKKGKNWEVYALKKLILFSGEKPDEFYARAAKEFIIHKNISSGFHIVNCYSLLQVPHISFPYKEAGGWGLVLELCKVDLFTLLFEKNSIKNIHYTDKLCLFKQIAFGLKFMHEHDVCHRDLKPENVLLDKNGVIKLTDFGVSDYGHEIPGDFTSPIVLSTQLVGSPPYQPPEVQSLNGIPREKRTPYNPFSMDCWSLGIILHCLFYDDLPFTKADNSDPNFKDYEKAYNDFSNNKPQFRKDKAVLNLVGTPPDLTNLNDNLSNSPNENKTNLPSMTNSAMMSRTNSLQGHNVPLSSAAVARAVEINNKNTLKPHTNSSNTSKNVSRSSTTHSHSNSAEHLTNLHKPSPSSTSISFSQFSKTPCPIDSKFAKKFTLPAIARVAWRLADPQADTRWSIYDLFSDAAFQSWELCVDEDDSCLIEVNEEEMKNEVDDEAEELNNGHEHEREHEHEHGADEAEAEEEIYEDAEDSDISIDPPTALDFNDKLLSKPLNRCSSNKSIASTIQMRSHTNVIHLADEIKNGLLITPNSVTVKSRCRNCLKKKHNHLLSYA